MDIRAANGFPNAGFACLISEKKKKTPFKQCTVSIRIVFVTPGIRAANSLPNEFARHVLFRNKTFLMTVYCTGSYCLCYAVLGWP